MGPGCEYAVTGWKPRAPCHLPIHPGPVLRPGPAGYATTSRPAGPIYLITAIDQAVQARTSSSQNFEGMLKPAVRRPGRDGPPRPREERRRGAAARRGVLECVLQTLWSAARRPGRGTGLNGHTHRRAAVRSRAQHAGLSLLVTTIGSNVLINSKEDAFDLPVLVLDEVQTLSAVCEERYRVSLPMRGARAFSHESKTFRERQRET